MNDEDLGLDDERHMAHYRFAFVLLPVAIFGTSGAVIIQHFLDGNGRVALGALWFRTNPDVDIEHEAFFVDDRQLSDGSIQFVANMPTVTAGKLEAHFVGLHVPAQVIRSLEVGENLTDGVRLIFLEESGFGLTMVGELGGPGVHTNLGYGPEPSREAMWDVMNNILDSDPHR